MARDIVTERILNSDSPEYEKKRAERKAAREKLKEEEQRNAAAAQRRGKIFRRLIVAVLIFFLFVVVVFGRLVVQISELKQAKEEAQKNLDDLQMQIEELEETLENVTSPEYIESQARSLLRMIYPNEIMYIIEEETE